MAVPDFQPCWFDSTETGAPVLNNAAGSLVEILKACLVTGFNLRPVTQIVVSGEVATATAANHGYSGTIGKLLLIDGAPDAGLNGRVQPINVTANTWQYSAPGVADGVYTGGITAKRAPLGWVVAHENGAGNAAMFARTHSMATAMLLRINDSGTSGATATDARVLMVEQATDVDTYTGASPTQTSGGGYWFKGANSVAAKQWALFGDGLLFYLVIPNQNGTISSYMFAVHAFGDVDSIWSPDSFCCILASDVASIASGSTGVRLGISYSLESAASTGSLVFARDRTGSSASRVCSSATVGQSGAPMGSNVAGPSNIDTFSIAQSVPIFEAVSGGVVRGVLPGLACPLARAPFAGLGQFATVDAVDDGLSYISVLHRTSVGTTHGNILIQMSRPWR